MRFEPTTPENSITLPALLAYAAHAHAGQELITYHPDGRREVSTYGALHERARRLAVGLRAAGLQTGDAAGTLMWNHTAHFEAHFGVSLAGGVLVPLNFRLHGNMVAGIAARSELDFVLADNVWAPLVEAIRACQPLRRTWFHAFSGSAAGRDEQDTYEALIENGANSAADDALPTVQENDPALVCYTSGTTGVPKCVVYSHKSLVLHSLATALPDVFGFSRNHTVLTVVPFFHISGWTLPFAAMLVGARQVFPGANTAPEALLDMLNAERVTFTAGVPTIWHGVLAALEANPGRWRFDGALTIMIGGSQPPEALIAGLEHHGINVIHTWGMTETMAAASISNPAVYGLEKAAPREIARQGVPIPLTHLRICSAGREVPPDGRTAGELQAKGPWVTERYHGTEQGTAGFTTDGWLRTGDIAVRDQAGAIRLVDREKDLIKSGGEWISSLALENAIMNHPGVALAAVVAYPHPKWQERPVAFVVRKPGQMVHPEELRALLEAEFPKWSLPDAFEFVDDLPRMPSGKLDRATLRAQARGLPAVKNAGDDKGPA